MRCENTEALNRREQKTEKTEKYLYFFKNDIEDDLIEIENIANRIKDMAKDYYEYDFTEDAKELIKERI